MAAQALAPRVGVAPACQALGVSRATFYRRQRPATGHQQPHTTPARALQQLEREHVLDVLSSERFVDRSPAEVLATLLDEGQFKTLKYHPGFPSRFAGIEETTAFWRAFFPWYNTEHHHGGIAMLTPHDVHYGHAEVVLAQRLRTLEAACAAHPERFVRGTPKPEQLPDAVWINPPNSLNRTAGIAR